MTLRALPFLFAAVITAAGKMSLNRMNSAHNFITFFCACGFFMEKHSTFSAFKFISPFSWLNGFYNPYFMSSSLFLFRSLCFVKHCSLSQTQGVPFCVLFSCMLTTSVTLSWSLPLSFTALHFELPFSPTIFYFGFGVFFFVLVGFSVVVVVVFV